MRFCVFDTDKKSCEMERNESRKKGEYMDVEEKDEKKDDFETEEIF